MSNTSQQNTEELMDVLCLISRNMRKKLIIQKIAGFSNPKGRIIIMFTQNKDQFMTVNQKVWE